MVQATLCPEGSNGLATRECQVGGIWSNANMSLCMNNALASFKLNTTTNISDAFSSLMVILSGGSNLGSLDVLRIVNILNELNQHWTQINNDAMESASNLSKIIDGLMNISLISLDVANSPHFTNSQTGFSHGAVTLFNWTASVFFDDIFLSLFKSSIVDLLSPVGLQNIIIIDYQHIGTTMIIRYQVCK